ncbi:hypothetical protein AB5N19_09832 [Seiridium cardinale]
MAFNYTSTTHRTTYDPIAPTLPHLSASEKIVIIAGGSAGIGKATALAFLEAGSRRLALTGRREEMLLTARSELASKYPDAKIITFAADVTDEAGVNHAFATVKEELGPANVIVNSAGVAPVKPLVDSDINAWWATFETNVKGAAIVAQAVAKHASPSATVLQLSTAGALFPAGPGFPISSYAASKLAVTKVMEYFGAENPGLKVITVHPGVVVDTPGGQKMVEDSGVPFQGDDSKSFFRVSYAKCCLEADVLALINSLVDLPAHFLVWAASEESNFLKNKFVFATWDVEELKARQDEIANSLELIIGLNGVPRQI